MRKTDSTTTIQDLKRILKKFRDQRDWTQFHDPKNLAEAISIEAAELQELFLWKDKETITKRIVDDPEFRAEIEKEIADVVIFCINFANAVDVDLSSVIRKKVKENNKKYSVKKSKGKSTKYTKL